MMNVRAHTTCLSARGAPAAPTRYGRKGTDASGEPLVSLLVSHSFVAGTRFFVDLYRGGFHSAQRLTTTQEAECVAAAHRIAFRSRQTGGIEGMIHARVRRN